MVILVCQQLVSANSLVIIYLVTVPSEYYQQFFFLLCGNDQATCPSEFLP